MPPKHIVGDMSPPPPFLWITATAHEHVLKIEEIDTKGEVNYGKLTRKESMILQLITMVDSYVARVVVVTCNIRTK